ncbi:hypothetical protein [Clostridium sulfidigenes]|uniref:hypothetical protein n=1 Tax=Clostridium sulfidigenes TaxID=318464 RepID=UPI000A58896A|nr:hypothetical protein [Clostridium sulfidigenes]
MKRRLECKDESNIERVEQLWKFLNERGIYTEQQLYSELKKRELDIGVFTLKVEDDKAE